MLWISRLLANQMFLMDTPKGDAPPAPPTPAPKGDTPDPRDAAIAALTARLDAYEKKAAPIVEPPLDLAEKVKKEREAGETKAVETKALETALHFSMSAPEWIKTNATLLPKTVPGIFAQADKENYANAIEKAAAIKVGIIQEFFSQQQNLDLLTLSLKTSLDDFLKLTKNVKQERASQIYDAVFEPTFEMLKRVKKAEQIAKGHSDPSDSESAYKEKMKAISKKQYLGVK